MKTKKQKRYEKYIQNFWDNPKVGHIVAYKNDTLVINGIFENTAQASAQNYDKIIWLQDCEWRPTLEDFDTILIKKFGCIIQGNQISKKTPYGNNCYHIRPTSIKKYTDLVREIRAYTWVNQGDL